jgi:hypothetical protein
MDKDRIAKLSFGLAAGLAALLLAGCAENKERKNEIDLLRISRWFPGTYNNTVQAKEDVRNGVQPAHDAVELAIVPLDSISMAVSVGRNAYYMQESAADDPLRVLSQKVVVFTATSKGIEELIFTLVDPLRWRDAQREPGIFMGMTPKDLTQVSGCELTWKREQGTDNPPKKKLTKDEAKKAEDHGKFIGINDRSKCKTTSHALMGLVQVELRAELTHDELATGELQFDSNGKVILGNPDQPFYRFQKIK